MEQWIVKGWLYIILMSVAIGAIVELGSMLAIKFGLRRKWINAESFLLWPTAIGVRIIPGLQLRKHTNSTFPAFHHWCLRCT
jgi:hypothetical protein